MMCCFVPQPKELKKITSMICSRNSIQYSMANMLSNDIYLSGYFLGARPASLAHTISYWRTNIPTFGPLGAPGAHRLTFRWALVQFLHSLKCKLFVIYNAGPNANPGSRVRICFRDHFVRNATRLPRRIEFPCDVGDIQPQTAYPTIPHIDQWPSNRGVWREFPPGTYY